MVMILLTNILRKKLHYNSCLVNTSSISFKRNETYIIRVWLGYFIPIEPWTHIRLSWPTFTPSLMPFISLALLDFCSGASSLTSISPSPPQGIFFFSKHNTDFHIDSIKLKNSHTRGNLIFWLSISIIVNV
jgi:hypothetical protein